MGPHCPLNLANQRISVTNQGSSRRAFANHYLGQLTPGKNTGQMEHQLLDNSASMGSMTLAIGNMPPLVGTNGGEFALSESLPWYSCFVQRPASFASSCSTGFTLDLFENERA
jgi:hypothetical protein